jgi:hypothetical protein
MAIKQLTDEQVRTMTVEEKDRWWLENVYQGDVRQMTPRVIICGFLLGGGGVRWSEIRAARTRL